MRRFFWPLCLAALLAGAQTVRADVWDLDSNDDEDDSVSTDNLLTHGIVQVHDLAAEAGVIDQDWYYVTSEAYSSYEVLVGGVTGDVFSGTLPVDRLADDGTTVLGVSTNLPTAVGIIAASRTLRWEVGASGATGFIRITGDSTGCTTACTENDQYTIQFRETTGTIARFNNSGTQVTVLLLQNTANYAVSGNVYYFNASGAPVGSQAFALNGRGLASIATASTVPGASGSIRVTHNGRFGDLSGKSVALEPATGFSFDTPMVTKPY